MQEEEIENGSKQTVFWGALVDYSNNLREAANLGEIGEVIARVGSMNAVGWLR